MELFFISMIVIVIGFTIFSTIFIIGFLIVGGRKVSFDYINQSLALKKLKIKLFEILAWVVLGSFVLSILPLLDFLLNINWFPNYSFTTGMRILDSFSISNAWVDFYFLYLVVGIVGAKFALKIIEIAPILKIKKIETVKFGALYQIK